MFGNPTWNLLKPEFGYFFHNMIERDRTHLSKEHFDIKIK